MRKLRNALVVSAGVLTPVVCRAEVDLSDLETGVTAYATAGLTVVGAVIVAALGLWALPKMIRVIKGAFSAGAGK
jgi:hypothetical protein